MENNAVTLPSIEDIDHLLERWKLQSGHENRTKEDLFKFLITPSVERELFLNENCVSSIKLQGDVLIKKLKKNEPVV